jgi:hypothetical protein
MSSTRDRIECSWNISFWNQFYAEAMAASLNEKTHEDSRWTFALSLTLACTGPAFAADVATAKTKDDCQKAGGGTLGLICALHLWGRCRRAALKKAIKSSRD